MRKTFIAIAACCILAAGFAVAAPPQSAQAEASFAPSSIALRTPVNGWTTARLVVAGPEGFRVERTFLAGEPVAVDFSRLKDAKGDRVEVPDGRFKWELTLTAPIPGVANQPDDNDTPLQAWVSSGPFTVENGSFVAPPEVRELPAASGEANGPIGPVGALTTNPYGNYFSGSVQIGGNLCAGSTACTDGTDPGYDIQARDTSLVELDMYDTGSTDADTGHWGFLLNAASSTLTLSDNEHGTTPLTLEEYTPTNTLYLDSTGSVGINTSTPARPLHVKNPSSSAVIRFEEAGGGYGQLFFGSLYMGLTSYPAGGVSTEPFRIYNGAPNESIKVQSSGDVVIGPFTNYAPFTVGYNTTATNSLVAPMIVTTYSTGTPANGFGAMTQWGLEAADGTLAVAADFGGLWENASAKDGYLIFRAAHNGGATEYLRIEGSSGYVGFGVTNPAYPIHHGSGARLTTGGVWTDASSRAFKQDIETLDADAAMAAFKELTPVTYAYKADPTEHHAGFIAEDVPDLVASGDRTGLAPMDVVAVLTKVVQEQQKTIEQLEARLAELEAAQK